MKSQFKPIKFLVIKFKKKKFQKITHLKIPLLFQQIKNKQNNPSNLIFSMLLKILLFQLENPIDFEGVLQPKTRINSLNLDLKILNHKSLKIREFLQ